MIIFRTNAWDWDLTNYGLTFTEESSYFEDVLTKSYSFPITVELNQDVAYKLGLIHLQGITKYRNKVFGILSIDNEFYDAYIAINKVKGTSAEITFFYGKETLSVFDKKLKDLPFAVSVAPGNDLRAYAKTLLSSTWPTASHQFVSVYRDELSSKSNYKHFEGWVNQMFYSEGLSDWFYRHNINEVEEGTTVAKNRNVMAPMTYMLEVLRVGFKTEGLDLRGELPSTDFFKKVLLVPKNFMEQYAVTQYLNYSFSAYTYQEQMGNTTLNVYKQTHSPQNEGSYSLKIKVNMNAVMAQYFYLQVTQDGTSIYEVETQNQQVVINETLDITVDSTQVLDDIVVTMKLVQQPENISNFNNFTYEYREGQLNIFPSVYTIADYLPDLTFREYFNIIKNWLNLKVDYTENAVYLNFLENALSNFRFIDRSHLEIPEPDRVTNKNNLFKLNYPDDSQVMVNSEGQTFSDADFTKEETEELNFEVLPLKVETNFGKTTATYPEDEEDIMLLLYNGAVDGENIAVHTVNNRTLSVQDIYDWLWTKWLTFRANSEKVTDTFEMHYTEAIDLTEGEYKYNTRRLILSCRKKRISNEWYEVELTAETF